MTVSEPHADLPDLPGNIRIWTGWPIFDIKIAQHEMNAWMRSAGFVRGYGESPYRTISPLVIWYDQWYGTGMKSLVKK